MIDNYQEGESRKKSEYWEYSISTTFTQEKSYPMHLLIDLDIFTMGDSIPN